MDSFTPAQFTILNKYIVEQELLSCTNFSDELCVRAGKYLDPHEFIMTYKHKGLIRLVLSLPKLMECFEEPEKALYLLATVITSLEGVKSALPSEDISTIALSITIFCNRDDVYECCAARLSDLCALIFAAKEVTFFEALFDVREGMIGLVAFGTRLMPRDRIPAPLLPVFAALNIQV